MSKAKAKITVGLLVSELMNNFIASVTKGVMYAAQNADVNLVIIPCKHLDRDYSPYQELKYDYQYTTMLSYARKDNLDAILVMADCIGGFTTKERVCEMLQEYRDIPCVLIASKIEGFVNVSCDNYNGLKEGLEYLLNHLNCKKFCMIGGLDNHTDAFERKQAFYSVLTEHGIVLEDKNFIKGELSRDTKDVFEKLLDDNPDVEAIFCVNDDTAAGLYDVMKSRGLVPGKDIYVLGYDNTTLAATSKPSISSVWADNVRLGMESMKLLLDMYAGNPVSSKVLPTRFIKRESFGSTDEPKNELTSGNLDETVIEQYFNNIFYRCINDVPWEQFQKIHKAYTDVMDKVSLLFLNDSPDVSVYNDLMEQIDTFMDSEILKYADIDSLIQHLHKVYRHLEVYRPRQAAFIKTHGTALDIFRRLAKELDFRIISMQENAYLTNHDLKLFLRDTLQFRSLEDQSYSVLLKRLSWLNIKNAYLYVFDNPICHTDREPFLLPEYIYLKAFLKNGTVHEVGDIQQKKRIPDIFCNDEIGSDRYSMILLPLFTGETLWGVFLCDMSDRLFEDDEFLSNQLGSAVNIIHLLNENELIQEKLEESLIFLRNQNIKLDNLSKIDTLTKIMNRRGFYMAAEPFLEKAAKEQLRVAVIYVDMNNLKIINDRYGHVEGDFALELIGQVLKEVVADRGIVGRIGGDEFTCIMEYNPDDGGNSFRKEIYERFYDYNMHSSKPYIISVSIGIHVQKIVDNIELEHLLSYADEKLYLEKKNRVQTVEKTIN